MSSGSPSRLSRVCATILRRCSSSSHASVSGHTIDARGDRVDAHLRRHFLRQRFGQRDQAGLGDAVQQMAVHRAFGVDVGDVHDAAMVAAQFGRGRLRQEQRGFQVGAEQVVPLLLVDIRQRGCVKAGRIVDQRIQLAEFQ